MHTSGYIWIHMDTYGGPVPRSPPLAQNWRQGPPWLIWARRQFWAKAWPFGASPYVSTIHMYAYVSICVRMCPYVCIPCPMSPVLRPVSCVLTHLRRSTFVSF